MGTLTTAHYNVTNAGEFDNRVLTAGDTHTVFTAAGVFGSAVVVVSEWVADGEKNDTGGAYWTPVEDVTWSAPISGSSGIEWTCGENKKYKIDVTGATGSTDFNIGILYLTSLNSKI